MVQLKKVQKKTTPAAKKKKTTKAPKKAEEIQVEFDFFNMNTPDFHSIKLFLNVAFGLNSQVNTSVLAGLISDGLSEYVGNTVKTEGEESDALGFTTIIPFCFDFSKSKDILGFYKEHLEFDSEKTAVVIHERVINLPPPVALQLYHILVQDFSAAKAELSAFKNIDTILISTPTLKVKKCNDENHSQSDEQSTEEEEVSSSIAVELMHEFREAELLDSLCIEKRDYKIPSSHETADSRRLFSKQGVEKWRSFYKLSLSAFLEYVKKMKELID